MWKNDQCWRRLNSQSLKSCCCGYSPTKLMKERSTDNSCCFDRSLPPHYWPDSYNQKKRILLPRKSKSWSERVIQARHCWCWTKIKVIANKRNWTRNSWAKSYDHRLDNSPNPRQERWKEPFKSLSPPCRTGKSKWSDTICSLSQKREFQLLMVSNANIFKSITLITND